MPKKKILLAMVEVGGGHKSPALAVQEALEKLYPGKFEIRVMDFFKEIGCKKLDKKLKSSWDFLLKHSRLCKSAYQLMEYTGRSIVRRIKKILFLPAYEKIAAFFQHYQPDLIFSTHFSVSFSLLHVRKQMNYPWKLINLNTDPFDVHLMWTLLEEIDYYVTCSQETKNTLQKKGIPSTKLQVFPYPIKDTFFTQSVTHQLHLPLDPNKKTLLISFGGQGIGNVQHFLNALYKDKINLNVIVVTAKNTKLKNLLEKKYSQKKGTVNLIVLGFVHNMPELMRLADFCFIKPGASLTLEAVALRKPLLLYKAAAPNEGGNIRYVESNQLGFYIGTKVKKFREVVKKLYQEHVLQKFQRAYEHLNIVNGAPAIAQFLVNILEEKSN